MTEANNAAGQTGPSKIIIRVMKTLGQSLVDYDLALLKAIATCRAVPLEMLSKSEAVQALAENLLSPTQTAIALSELSEAEKKALQFLVDNRGQVEGPRFTRQFGVIRPMGAARLEREQPWQKPANAAEGLWYKGFIFKAFQMTIEGNLEVIYVPTDLLPLLDTPPTTAADTPDLPTENVPPISSHQPTIGLQPALAPIPPVVVAGAGRLRESMFSLLAYLQTHPTKLQHNGQLSLNEKKALTKCLPSPLLSTFRATDELDFLVHLGQRAGLLALKRGRLKPDRDPTRTWLQASHSEQTQFLRHAWRSDPTWNDLWHVPGLVPKPTGWENSPLLARSKILGYLTHLGVPSGEWLSLDDFIAKVKVLDPDFQRPNGDYDSWYIYDTEGQSLMGFANWDRVEGALIRYLLTNILLLLGITDVGLLTETAAPTSFRITPHGEDFLTGHPAPSPPITKPVFLRVGTNFQVYVPDRASLYDRFQVTRFAELEQRQENRVVYQLSQASVGRALRNGITADQIVAFLARATNNQTPLKVVETLRTWGKRQGTVRLERATLLRLKHESLVEELRQNPRFGPLMGEVLGPTTILIPADNTQEVRRLLIELGYLAEGG